jgi:integrase
MMFFSKKFREVYGLDDITNITEEQIMTFFSDMRNGSLKRDDGKEYISVCTFVKNFKAFWHWHQKVSKKQGIEVPDITQDLDTSQEKPKWVYLTEEQVKKLCDNARYEYKILFMFLFDTGIRSPTELMNVRISDLYNNCKEVQIREETSKTFGRRVKLMICSELIKEFIKRNKLGENDFLFNISPTCANRYLKRLASKIFGNGESEAGGKFSEMTLYDFRHISCCYWLPRYKSESALKYRFGWKESDKIHYYSELLGMTDTISEDDMLIDVTKTEIENRLTKSEKDKEILQERVNQMEEQMKSIIEFVKVAKGKIEIIKELG